VFYIVKHLYVYSTRLTALGLGLPGWAGTRTNVDLLEQEIVSGSGISWAICKSAPSPREITTPLLQAGCPSCRPTNSVKALKAKTFILCAIIFVNHVKYQLLWC